MFPLAPVWICHVVARSWALCPICPLMRRDVYADADPEEKSRLSRFSGLAFPFASLSSVMLAVLPFNCVCGETSVCTFHCLVPVREFVLCGAGGLC